MHTNTPDGISGAEVARLLGVTKQAVSQWAKDGAPHARNGHRLAFRLAEVVNWRIEQAKAVTAPRDIAEERLRKVKAEADRVEIEVAKTRGTLLPVSLFEAEIGKEHDRMRAAVVSIPSKYAKTITDHTGCTMAVAVGALAALSDEILIDLQDFDEDDTSPLDAD